MRDNNEDAVAVDEATRLAVLADGMGGYNAGEVASNMLTGFIVHELGRWLLQASETASDAEVKRAMDICVDNANRAIFNSANTNPKYAGMGTTLVMTVFRQNSLLLGHIGDSRAYRWRDDHLQQITRDHSLLQEQLDAGLITPEEAAYSSNKNLVTRAVGVEDTVILDINQHDWLPGDLIFMCSDGLSDMLDDDALTQIMRRMHAHALPQIGNALIAAANEMGGRDNIAVILARNLLRNRNNPGNSGRTWWPFGRR